MIERDIRAALDDCLEAIENGASLDEALARHQEMEAELRPLVEQALWLRSIAPIRPDATRQNAARTRYLMRAGELRRRRARLGARRRALSWLAGALAPTRARVLQGIAAMIVVLLMAGGALVWTAGGVGADSSLYGVKLATESVRERLTRGDDAKAELMLGYLQTRQLELRDVLAKSETPDDRLLERLATNTQVAVAIVARTRRPDLAARTAGLLDEGTKLMLAAGPRFDGETAAKLAVLLDSTRIERDFVARLTGKGEAEVGIIAGRRLDDVELATARWIDSSVVVEDEGGNAVVRVGGQTYAVASGVKIGSGEVSRVVVADGRDGRSYVIAAEPSAERGASVTRVRGRVSEASKTDLRIGDQRILIDDSTIILNGPIAAGRVIAVEGTADGNGNIRASQIQALPDDDKGSLKSYRGVVTAHSGSKWVVGGTTFLEVGGSEIDLQALDPGVSPLGSTAQVEAVEHSDGTRAIRRLLVLPTLAAAAPTETPTGKPTASPTASALATTETPTATPTASATATATATADATPTASATPAPAQATPTQAAPNTWRVEGQVASLEDGGILVLRDGTRARIGPDTQLSGRLEVGARVAIDLGRGSGGVSSALSIQVLNVAKQQGEDEEPVAPLPGSAPLPTPTPAPSATASPVPVTPFGGPAATASPVPITPFGGPTDTTLPHLQ